MADTSYRSAIIDGTEPGGIKPCSVASGVHINLTEFIYFGQTWAKDVTNSIFELDERIRYIAILNPQYDLLSSRMREGILSLTPAQADRDFITIAAPLMTGAAEKLKPFCGTIRRMAVRYDRVLLVFYRTTAHLVILSLEPKVEKALLDRIGGSVRKLELVGSDEESKKEQAGKTILNFYGQ